VKFLLKRDLAIPGVLVCYPTSKLQPYTMMDGEVTNVWFDRHTLDPNAPELTASMDESMESFQSVFDRLVAEGVPVNKIVLGEFILIFDTLTVTLGLFCKCSKSKLHLTRDYVIRR
jgi:hypothetical protein